MRNNRGTGQAIAAMIFGCIGLICSLMALVTR